MIELLAHIPFHYILLWASVIDLSWLLSPTLMATTFLRYTVSSTIQYPLCFDFDTTTSWSIQHYAKSQYVLNSEDTDCTLEVYKCCLYEPRGGFSRSVIKWTELWTSRCHIRLGLGHLVLLLSSSGLKDCLTPHLVLGVKGRLSAWRAKGRGGQTLHSWGL